ncbi:MAG: lipid IV(A) 3-deoxy-D-manno-octulosonic acid transferase [Pseudomonadota bacterium]
MTRALYTWLLRLAFPYVCLRLFVRGFGNHAYWCRLPERFGYIPRLEAAHVIWVHAVSVGEVRAAAPLVCALLERYPGHRLVVTAMTPTGSATVTQLFGDRVAHCYAPYDYPAVVRRFLARAHPALTLILEKELWPNLIHACRARGIPVCVANAQLGAHSLRGWQRAPRLARATFGAVNAYAAQSQADAQRLIAAGARPETVHVVGSIKFDLALPPELPAQAAALRRDWGAGRPVWLAASTHEGEETEVLRAHAVLKARFPGLLLVLAPRHPERFDTVVRLCERAGLRVARRSDVQEAQMPQAAIRLTQLPPAVDVLVGDTMGELQIFYSACDVSFIGGSLVPAGGHNFLEAAAVGKPFVFGPDMSNIEEIARLAVARGAGVQIARGEQLAEAIGNFLADAGRRAGAGEAGRRMVEENRGALVRTLQLIEAALSAASR